MAFSNIDVQKFLTDKSDASMTAIEKTCSDSLLLHMLAEGLYADITFQAKGGTVKAHRCVLATMSTVFREMFQQEEMKVLLFPCRMSLPDMAIESLQLFLVLLYITKDKTRAMPEFNDAVDKHFIALFEAARKFQVEGRLYSVLGDGLRRLLTPDNCWDFYDRYDDYSESCLYYVVENCEKVMNSVSTVLQMQRDPEVVQSCLTFAMSRGLCCELFRQNTTLKLKKPNGQTHDHNLSCSLNHGSN